MRRSVVVRIFAPMADLEMLERLRSALRGRYELERELGSGGMAIVYRAHDPRHERFVALKVMRPEFAPTLGAERFLREIRLAAGLQHPHIVPLYDSGEAGGFLYYVMPHLEGESLRERLHRDAQLPVEEALSISREVADALQYAHSRGVIHRDIKPENIYLSGGHAQVLDFGIARAVSAASGLTLTEAGVAVGTPAYMSPEQAAADPRMDGRVDIYALGCVLYEMLGGTPPFAGPSAQVIMARHSTEAIPSVRVLRPQVSPTVESIVERMLAKLPADRYATAADLARALTTGTAPALPASAPSRPSRRVAGIVGILVTAVAAFTLWRVAVPEAGAEDALANPSIAVLPMRNLGDSTDAFFAEGLPRDVTSELTRVPGLAPRPFESVSRAFASETDPRRVGELLSADYVLSSSLQRDGQRFKVRAELMRVDDGSLVFANRVFDGLVSDLFAMQDSIARLLVAQLRGQLVAQDLALGAGQGRRDPEAHRLYQEGLHLVRMGNLRDAERASRYFEEAVAHDSTFADAWSELAVAYDWLSQFSGRAPTDIIAKARSAAEKAVSLDPVTSTAREFLARYRIYFEFDYEGYEAEARRAVNARPGYAEGHLNLGQNLMAFGSPDSALAELQRAVDLSPTDAFYVANLAGIYVQRGELERARSEALRAMAIDSTQWLGHFIQGLISEQQGDVQSASRFMEQARKAEGNDIPWLLAYVAYFHGRAGQRSEAERVIALLEEKAKRQYVQSVFLATARLGLGDRAGALEALEASMRARDRDFFWKVGYGEFEEMRDDPRYEDLLRQVGLDRLLRRPGYVPAIRLNSTHAGTTPR